MANSTGSDWGSWAAVVAAIFSGLGVGYSICKWGKRRWKLRTPFVVEYDPPIWGKQIVYPGEQRQGVKIRLKVAVYVLSIAFRFMPENNHTPQLNGLYDPSDTRDFDTDESNGYTVLRYDDPPHKSVDSIIRVGVKYVADFPYQGKLRVRLTTQDGGAKEECLLLNVEEDKRSG